jgi:hypothetical protein
LQQQLAAGPASVAQAAAAVQPLFDTAEGLETPIQLIYLTALLGFLAAGAYLVVRQVLIRRELDEAAKSLGERIRTGEATCEVRAALQPDARMCGICRVTLGWGCTEQGGLAQVLCLAGNGRDIASKPGWKIGDRAAVQQVRYGVSGPGGSLMFLWRSQPCAQASPCTRGRELAGCKPARCDYPGSAVAWQGLLGGVETVSAYG